MNDDDILSTGSRLSLKESLKDGKQMEWWVLAPIILAVVMFLLVGTIFEKKIEQKIKNFITSHLSREPSPDTVSTASNGNQTNIPTSSTDPCHQTTVCDGKTCPKKSTPAAPQEKQKPTGAHEKSVPDRLIPSVPQDQNVVLMQETQILTVQHVTQDLNAPLEAQDVATDSGVKMSLSRNTVQIRSRHLAPEIH